MSRVKRGMTAHARHKKILGMAKGYTGRNKNVFRELLLKRLKKVCNMLTVTAAQRKEVSVRCGFSVLMPQPVCMI